VRPKRWKRGLTTLNSHDGVFQKFLLFRIEDNCGVCVPIIGNAGSHETSGISREEQKDRKNNSVTNIFEGEG
jgi:hypothetical protein